MRNLYFKFVIQFVIFLLDKVCHEESGKLYCKECFIILQQDVRINLIYNDVVNFVLRVFYTVRRIINMVRTVILLQYYIGFFILFFFYILKMVLQFFSEKDEVENI